MNVRNIRNAIVVASFATSLLTSCNTTNRSEANQAGLNTVPPAPNTLIYRFKEPFSAGVTKSKNWEHITKLADTKDAGVCTVDIYEDTLVANGPTTAHIVLVFNNAGDASRANEQLSKVIDQSKLSAAAGGYVACAPKAHGFASRAATKLYLAMKGKAAESNKTRTLVSLHCRQDNGALVGCTAVKNRTDVVHYNKTAGKALFEAMQAVWGEQQVSSPNLFVTDLRCTETYYPGQEPMTEWACKFVTM